MINYNYIKLPILNKPVSEERSVGIVSIWKICAGFGTFFLATP